MPLRIKCCRSSAVTADHCAFQRERYKERRGKRLKAGRNRRQRLIGIQSGFAFTCQEHQPPTHTTLNRWSQTHTHTHACSHSHSPLVMQYLCKHTDLSQINARTQMHCNMHTVQMLKNIIFGLCSHIKELFGIHFNLWLNHFGWSITIFLCLNRHCPSETLNFAELK